MLLSFIGIYEEIRNLLQVWPLWKVFFQLKYNYMNISEKSFKKPSKNYIQFKQEINKQNPQKGCYLAY